MYRTRNILVGSTTLDFFPIAVVALYCILLSPSTVAQDTKLAPEKQTKLEVAIARFMAANSIPGVSVAVVENNIYEWSAGFGMADLENFVPATSQTLYRLASISKPITATATMLLWQQHKIDLDAPGGQLIEQAVWQVENYLVLGTFDIHL